MKLQTKETTAALTSREERKRQRLKNAIEPKQKRNEYAVWYDATALKIEDIAEIAFQLPHSHYTGVVLSADVGEDILTILPSGLQKIFLVQTAAEIDAVVNRYGSALIVMSDQEALLKKAQNLQVPTCLKFYVDSSETLHAAIAGGKRHTYLSIRFRDPTNIPLELVIASLQSTGTTLINEIADGESVEAAIVALGVMEVGADGIMFSPRSSRVLREFAVAIDRSATNSLNVVTATVISARSVGMGYRSCVDLATIFAENEGLLVGSTSHGGILCCPEVFHLPYMELRPFRINAGAVHSYVYGPDDQTNYLTELKAGSTALVVGLDGKTRRATVGRIKTELRPLRLIEVETDEGVRINTIMQDDWHVRVFSADGKPFNITELKPGDKVLAMAAKAGRHVGIAIDEHILEN